MLQLCRGTTLRDKPNLRVYLAACRVCSVNYRGGQRLAACILAVLLSKVDGRSLGLFPWRVHL